MIIGISGASGSGKTVFASTIVNELNSYNVAIISEDNYYKNQPHLSFDERKKLNYDHPDSLDHDLLIADLKRLKDGQEIYTPVYDYKLSLRSSEMVKVLPHKITILEGILIFHEERMRDIMDILIYIDTPLDLAIIRRTERDMKERGREFDFCIHQYLTMTRPMYFEYIEPTKNYADIVVPKGGQNRVAIEIIKARINELLLK